MSSQNYNRYLAAIKAANDSEDRDALRQIQKDLIKNYGLNDNDVNYLIRQFRAALASSDVSENASYAETVEYLSEIGVMRGDANGNFNPDKPVSRAEMATIICRMLGETDSLSTSNAFTDVPASHWANRYITKAASLGIIGGLGNLVP